MFQSCIGGIRGAGGRFKREVVETAGWDSNANNGMNGTSTKSRKERYVLEIVGAMGLSTIADDIDSYCVVTHQSEVIHRTKTIDNDTAPIWTMKTKSICFVEVHDHENKKHDPAVKVELCRQLTGIPGLKSETVIGCVELTYSMLVNGNGTRQEYQVSSNEHSDALLALRFRKATDSDWNSYQVLVLQQSPTTLDGTSVPVQDHAGDIDFKNISSKGLLGNKKTLTVDGIAQTAYRVWPFPNPEDVKGTTYLTKSQIQETATLPSKSWVEAAGGAAENYGSVFLEILGCDDLPNMDAELVQGLTDAFVACVYEDNFVRTAVIHDTLNPRWMPWTHRAFEFHIQHPSSILMLGVFDYDHGPLESHDAIGRVVIVPTLFEKDTVYTLKYPLYHDEEFRGTLTVRLRIYWHNAADASKAQSFVRPPRFMINVQTEKSWRTLRYLTRGSIDMTDVTFESVKQYATEVLEHWQRYCYLLDVTASILLWRGRTALFGVSVWFPIHSIFLLGSFVLAVERPEFLPSVGLYLIAYALLWNNYYLSSHPSPWSRVRSFARVAVNNHFSSSSKVEIQPDTGVEDEKILTQLDQYKGLRVMGFLYTSLYAGLNVYRVYSKNTPVDISTESKTGSILSKLYVNHLSYAHLLLRSTCAALFGLVLEGSVNCVSPHFFCFLFLLINSEVMCKYSRVLRNFVNWRTGSTYKFTIDLLLFATSWTLFPYKHVVISLTLRIVVFMLFGPQNKLIDMLWIQPYYRTKEQLLADSIPETVAEMKQDIADRPNIMDPILKSTWLREMGKSGRIVVEDNVKLQAVRAARYGKFSEAIPAVDTSRFVIIPTPSSFAQALARGDEEGEGGGLYRDIAAERKKWSRVPGQKLYGNIIPQPPNIIATDSTTENKH